MALSSCMSRPAGLPAACVGLLLAACAAGPAHERREAGPPVSVTVAGHNAVSTWNEIAAATINQPPAATGTPEERRPISANDLATVHVAIHDAVMAIAGTHRPLVFTLAGPVAGASPDAAAGAAAYGVLKALFPSRGGAYEAAYAKFTATLPEGEAKARGLALGAQVAAAVVATRANDGRAIALAPYVPGSGPGQFRNATPINRFLPAVKPFVLTSNAQFRAPPPPALTSAAYAAAVAETRALGAAASATRSAEQTEVARFSTEAPPLFWARNLRRFLMTDRPLADHARVGAMLWVAQADAINACFESKYHYNTWRPFSAIQLADTDGNDATTADPAWAPVVPTPNHPEYPAAHSCAAGAVAAALRAFYGTNEVRFEFDSNVTGTMRRFATPAAMVDEIAGARIAGGMHFRYATDAGARLGDQVGEWVVARSFARRQP
jgi:PAP2 superfamily